MSIYRFFPWLCENNRLVINSIPSVGSRIENEPLLIGISAGAISLTKLLIIYMEWRKGIYSY
uniref:Uncharacterized protein n=1 Tax=Picea glauca TaxID=3330 RepID=A0A101M0H3_PICGL|nr:hypothetical protein ABT39_MTgene4102 [Picea glauca]